MKKNLIVFTHGGGRLANQMTNHAHLIAFQKEYQESFEVINLAFGPYSQLFQKMQTDKVPRMPADTKKLKLLISIIGLIVKPREYKMTLFNQVLRLAHLVFVIFPFSQSIKYGSVSSYLGFLPGSTVDRFDLNHTDSLSLLKRKRITLLCGWPIRSWTLFKKHESAIRSSFAIRDDYKQNATTFIQPIRDKYDILIGALLRQDDYRTWAKGKYFFTTDQYISFMNKTTDLFPGKSVAFIIASDEAQDVQKFNGINAHFTTGSALGKGHFIESFAELSLCDYVMTVPSTFGVWAAFLGNIPIIPLFEKNQNITSTNLLKNHLFDCLKHPHMSVSVS